MMIFIYTPLFFCSIKNVVVRDSSHSESLNEVSVCLGVQVIIRHGRVLQHQPHPLGQFWEPLSWEPEFILQFELVFFKNLN